MGLGLGRLNLENVNPHLRGGRVENHLGKNPPFDPTEIRSSLSPSSAVWLNTSTILLSRSLSLAAGNSPLPSSRQMNFTEHVQCAFKKLLRTELCIDYSGGNTYNGTTRADGKVVIVTGANTGVGKETVRELAARGAHVILACRDMDKCEKAREEIVLETKNKYLYCRECDLASQSSIRNFVKRFGKVLVCNLKASAPSRIINVSSVAHMRGKINTKDLNSENDYDPGEAYNQSKLANILFTRELARRLQGGGVEEAIPRQHLLYTAELLTVGYASLSLFPRALDSASGTGVTVNAVHPGIVDTELTRHMSFFNSTLSALLLKPFVWLFIKSPRQGAQTTLYAVLDENLQHKTGIYFSNCKEQEPADSAKDDTMAQWLWKNTSLYVGTPVTNNPKQTVMEVHKDKKMSPVDKVSISSFVLPGGDIWMLTLEAAIVVFKVLDLQLTKYQFISWLNELRYAMYFLSGSDRTSKHAGMTSTNFVVSVSEVTIEQLIQSTEE
uniref:Uncharacterized protein n=1 Tax=Timema douglasi TaxID=61478 RepID=A0A7R8VNM7_TIMDO|nr:unnamed protein product [Timema douglasi]